MNQMTEPMFMMTPEMVGYDEDWRETIPEMYEYVDFSTRHLGAGELALTPYKCTSDLRIIIRRKPEPLNDVQKYYERPELDTAQKVWDAACGNKSGCGKPRFSGTPGTPYKWVTFTLNVSTGVSASTSGVVWAPILSEIEQTYGEGFDTEEKVLAEALRQKPILGKWEVDGKSRSPDYNEYYITADFQVASALIGPRLELRVIVKRKRKQYLKVPLEETTWSISVKQENGVNHCVYLKPNREHMCRLHGATIVEE